MSEHVQVLPTDGIPIFTDGSSLTNLGVFGSAAIVFTAGINHQPVTVKKVISKCSTSFHKEVAVIELALNNVIQ